VLSAKRDALNERVGALAQGGSDFEALEKLSLELAGLSADLDAKTERWFELADIAGDI
jgi:ATP-binding cassette subfamily F protein uup